MNQINHVNYFLSQPRMPAPAMPRTRTRKGGSVLSRARKAFAAR